MQAAFTDTQDALREAVADLLGDHATGEDVRSIAFDGAGFDADLWSRLVAMGVTDLPGAVEEGVVAEELGGAVAPVPYVEHLVALAALRAAAPDHAMVATLSGGDAIGVLAADGVLRIEDGAAHGDLRHVPHGGAATHLVAIADDGRRQVLVVLDATATTRTGLPTMDRTRPLVDIGVDGVGVEVIDAADVRSPASLTAAVLYAHDLVGVGQACLDMAVAYARDREQFGKPIGTYQAVSHRLVDMFVALESARSHTYHAAWATAADDDVAALAASQAKASASDAAVSCAQGAIQVHGGIGFTWEHDLHLYLKRARSGSALWGTASQHRRQVADHLVA
ncbi:MAG: acyl-CoA/acyl-ACP dehydrogenase [Actinobacteria bacterium]|nr:acyl-CoA/acyl-ACP dehydrogenase [Actinomycetota bacterium]